MEALKALEQSLDALDRRNRALLFLFCLLKFRKEAKKVGAGERCRQELARELGEMLREMEGFLESGRSEGDLAM